MRHGTICNLGKCARLNANGEEISYSFAAIAIIAKARPTPSCSHPLPIL